MTVGRTVTYRRMQQLRNAQTASIVSGTFVVGMRIHIDKQGEVPIRLQLREQIIFLISTGELSIGEALPSVRQLARRIDVHHNSVSRVYGELVNEGWLEKRPGTRLVVVQRKTKAHHDTTHADGLDDLIDRIITSANEHGFSLQQLAQRLRERLLAEPPDHFLIVEPEKELGALIREELRDLVGPTTAVCSVPMLRHNPALAIGSIIVVPGYLRDGVEFQHVANRTVIPINYSPAEPCLNLIKTCKYPSMVGVISVSPGFLRTASGLISPELADRHSLCTFLMELPGAARAKVARIRRFDLKERRTRPTVRIWSVSKANQQVFADSISEDQWPDDTDNVTRSDLRNIDLLFCDSITFKLLKHPKRVHYRLLSDESINKVSESTTLLRVKAAVSTA